jgi:hypothetical protein
VVKRTRTSLSVFSLALIAGGGVGLVLPFPLHGEGEPCEDQKECYESVDKCRLDMFQHCLWVGEHCYDGLGPDCPEN